MTGTAVELITPAGPLQVRINDAHTRVITSASNMVGYAVECGGLLIEAKERIPHGGWAAWLEENFEGSGWVARKYMQLARAEASDVGSITGISTITSALKSIATPRQAQIEAAKPDPDSSTGLLLANARDALRDNSSEKIIDAVVVADAPFGIEERRWTAALRRQEDFRRTMNEAVNPSLTPAAASQALQEASISARRFAVDLEQMAEAIRRRAA